MEGVGLGEGDSSDFTIESKRCAVQSAIAGSFAIIPSS